MSYHPLKEASKLARLPGCLTALGANIARDTKVDQQVVLGAIGLGVEATKDREAVAAVDIPGNPFETRPDGGKRKGVLRDRGGVGILAILPGIQGRLDLCSIGVIEGDDVLDNLVTEPAHGAEQIV